MWHSCFPASQGPGHKAQRLDLAADAHHNMDVAMQVSGHTAAARGFNFQLAHSSQSPVTELQPSQKGVCLSNCMSRQTRRKLCCSTVMPAETRNAMYTYAHIHIPQNLYVRACAGFYDVMGNAWEWGEDHYSAYPGFKVHPVYEDFSAPCFAGKHQLVSGRVRRADPA